MVSAYVSGYICLRVSNLFSAALAWLCSAPLWPAFASIPQMSLRKRPAAEGGSHERIAKRPAAEDPESSDQPRPITTAHPAFLLGALDAPQGMGGLAFGVTSFASDQANFQIGDTNFAAALAACFVTDFPRTWRRGGNHNWKWFGRLKRAD